jgi:hypothetical protein
MFQAKVEAAAALHGAITTKSKGPAPDILHYLWLVTVPGVTAPAGYTTFLLTTVYDEDFKSYIGDLVNNNPTPFNQAAAGILGFEEIDNKLPDKAVLSRFITLIGERDLTQTHPVGAPSFIPFYPWSAAAIHKHMHGGPAPEPAHGSHGTHSQ